MSYLSGTQLAILRRPFQATDLYLAFYQPPVVEHGRVYPDAPTQGLPTELADNYYIDGFTATNAFTSGTVKPGMTLVFGSAPGLEDLGRTFIRSKSGSHYYFSVLENMPLASGIYYRIYDYFEIWPVFPRVTVSEDNIISYFKNYDQSYNGQNSNFTPVAVVGPNTAAFVDPNGQKAMLFIGTGSYTVDGTAISQVYWEINTNPVTILTGSIVSYTFPRSGHYTIEARVVNTSSITGTAHRHYILLNRDQYPGSYPSVRDWKFEGMEGDWDSGGYQLKISVGDEADEIRDGALVIVFADDIYGGGAPQSFGGYPDREQIVFSGYVDKIDTTNRWDTSRSVVHAKSAINLLQNRDMFSVSLETSPNPIDWTQIKNMTINRIIDHYLRWHSTFLDVCDYVPCPQASASYGEQYEDIPRGEIFSNVRNILQNRLLANFVSDRQGRVFSEVNLNYIITGSRPNTTLVFENGDWIGQIKTVEDLESRTSSILLGGVSYDSAVNTGTAYLSRAPDALFPLHFGKAETKSGMTIDSQNTLNTLCGLYLADLNTRFPSISMQMANNQRSIEIVPQEFYQLPATYPFTDEDLRNLRQIWANRRMIPRKVNYTYKNFVLQQEVVFDTETHGPAGETVRIPAQPPSNGTPSAPEPPGVVIGVPTTPPGLGTVTWEVQDFNGVVYDVQLYGDYVYVCGIDQAATPANNSFRVEKRRQSDGGLEWNYNLPVLYPSGVVNATAFALFVDADGVFACGSEADTASGHLPTWVVVKITDAGVLDWRRNIGAGAGTSQALDITKIGSSIFVAGVYPGVTGRLEKLDGSGGIIAADTTEEMTSVDGTDDRIFTARLEIDAWNFSLSQLWSQTIVGQFAQRVKVDDTYVYTYMIDTVSGTLYMSKRLRSDGSLVFSEDFVTSGFTNVFKVNMALGTNFIHIPYPLDSGGKIYQLSKTDGSNFTQYSTIQVPQGIAISGNSLYIGGGTSSSKWYVARRALSYS